VVIWSLADLNDRHSVEKGMHNGQRDWNFEDVKVNYEYDQCFTQDTDFNFTQKSFVMRAKYTEETFNHVEKCNPNFWGEWRGGYMDMVEESMCMGKIMREMMENTFRDAKGHTLIKSPQEILTYKQIRAEDALHNWSVYNRMSSNMGSADTSSDITTTSTGSGDMSMDVAMENTTDDSEPPQNVPLTQTEGQAANDPPALTDVAIEPSNAASDTVPTVPCDVIVGPILPAPQVAGPSGKLDQHESLTGVLSNPDNVQDVYFGAEDLLVMRQYDDQYDDSMGEHYQNEFGKEQGAIKFEEYRKIRQKVMIKNWKKDMRQGVPLIAKDPTFVKEILAANPNFVAATMQAMIEDWDPLWKSLKQNTYLYDNFKSSVQQKFEEDEHLLAKSMQPTGNQQAVESYGEFDSANPALRNDTTTPQPDDQQAQQQSDAEANIT